MSRSHHQKLSQQELKLSSSEPLPTRSSPEEIDYKILYSQEDLSEQGFTPSFPGLPPYTRGPKATMYRGKPWTIRQYAGFSSAAQSNAFYKQNLAQGQRGLSVAFDLPTHRGYDSSHPRAQADVGKAGVAIDHIEDMKILFDGIDLSQMSVSMTMNGAVLPILGCYIVAAEEQGVQLKDLRGTLQNDILKEYLVRNTFIYPPEPSMEIVAQIIKYTSQHMPQYNSISISGYHIQEAGADRVTELAYTLANGLEYIDAALGTGLAIDDFAPRLSFFFGIGMNFFMEIAKLRAARRLWHDLMIPYQPKNPKSSVLRMHCQTSGYSLCAQDSYNNIVRTTIEAMSGILGGTQSLHTNAFDEAISLPSPFSAQLARNTQLILHHETDLTHCADPLGGSYFVESLTASIYDKALAVITQIRNQGGMMQAISSGRAKAKIEQAAAQKQARLDSGEDILVGVNRYQSQNSKPVDHILKVDHQQILEQQLSSLKALKAKRNQARVDECLQRIRHGAKHQPDDLVESVTEAIRCRTTLGECSLALEDVYGRYEPVIQATSSTYSKSYVNRDELDELITRVDRMSDRLGRRPRILLVKLGQDGHDRGIKVVASGLADFGFDVDMGALFAKPEEAAKQAVENDPHIIGVSSQAGGHTQLVTDLKRCLQKQQADHIHIIVGGVVPDQDHPELIALGCKAIFGPGTSLVDCAYDLLDILETHNLTSTE